MDLLVVLMLTPVVAALVAVAGGRSRWTVWFGVLSSVAVLVEGVAVGARVLDEGTITAADGALRADALSAFMVIVIGSVSTIATVYGVEYVDNELRTGETTQRRARIYDALVQSFIAAMLLAVLAGNLGVVWAAVEATTIATAFLVGHHRSRSALEASWKYVIIGSVGVAMAFLGTALVYFAAHNALGEAASLNWDALVGSADQMDDGVMRLATGLLLLGFGTKAGLAPMHTWLPDAHSQAPAPVSALMSGVLLSVAFSAILRCRVVANAALGPEFVRNVLLVAGVMSLLVAALLLISQRDYKRMLAYSSIEHMGIIAVGTAFGTTLAMRAVLLHIVGHALVKAVLFCTSGEVLRFYRSTLICDVRGMLARQRATGFFFVTGCVALLALPPFSIFASEMAVVRAGFDASMGGFAAAMLVMVLVAFGAIAWRVRDMVLGEGEGASSNERMRLTSLLVLGGGLSGAAALGVSLHPIAALLYAAAEVVAG